MPTFHRHAPGQDALLPLLLPHVNKRPAGHVSIPLLFTLLHILILLFTLSVAHHMAPSDTPTAAADLPAGVAAAGTTGG